MCAITFRYRGLTVAFSFVGSGFAYSTIAILQRDVPVNPLGLVHKRCEAHLPFPHKTALK